MRLSIAVRLEHVAINSVSRRSSKPSAGEDIAVRLSVPMCAEARTTHRSCRNPWLTLGMALARHPSMNGRGMNGPGAFVTSLVIAVGILAVACGGATRNEPRLRAARGNLRFRVRHRC